MNPHAIGSHALIGVDLALLGRGEDALAEIAHERHSGYRLWALSIAHWTLGNHGESDAALAELKKSPDSNAYWVGAAVCRSRQEESGVRVAEQGAAWSARAAATC